LWLLIVPGAVLALWLVGVLAAADLAVPQARLAAFSMMQFEYLAEVP
jgi:hypothetical protein